MARGILKFNKDFCKGCELCIAACPKKILQISEVEVNAMGYHTITVIDPDKCTGCSTCALMCPDGVITVYME